MSRIVTVPLGSAPPRKGVVSDAKPDKYAFNKVLDGRKQPIRGLWQRNGTFYAQMTVKLPSGAAKVKRVKLKADSVAAAVTEMHGKIQERDKGELIVFPKAPPLGEFIERYLADHKSLKSEKTLKTETSSLNQWKQVYGKYPLDAIHVGHLNEFRAARLKAGVGARTVNADRSAIRNVFQYAKVGLRLIAQDPTDGTKPAKYKAKRKQLLTTEEVEAMAAAALKFCKFSGKALSNLILLLASTGMRVSEAMALRWEDVEWERRRLAIGQFRENKNREVRYVDFNPRLETVLKGMQRPDAKGWLFPNERSAKKPEGETAAAEKKPCGSMRKAFEGLLERLKVEENRKAVGLTEDLDLKNQEAFHLFRHYFISQCVMAGIDFMTIATWVGHKDGGVLIGKVYGHLANDHSAKQAQKLTSL
ncbi:MAG TPA: site-specific integrase [Methylomirabilota bacterium]|nr:site-specific integrase [Methylomirabilota bacterium]